MQHHNTAPATTITKYGDAEPDPRVCASPSLAQIWRAVRSFGAWASKVGQSRHNMGTLEAAVWSMVRPARPAVDLVIKIDYMHSIMDA